MIQILANEATAANRRVYLKLVLVTDHESPDDTKDGSQPTIMVNGAAFTATGIGTLVSVAHGWYYAQLTQAIVLTAGTIIVPWYADADVETKEATAAQVIPVAPTLAGINAEVVDALNVDTYAEPGQGAPAATLSLIAKVNYLYKAWRNRMTQTSTTYSLYNDAASAVDQKAAVSDDNTILDKGEIGSGP